MFHLTKNVSQNWSMYKLKVWIPTDYNLDETRIRIHDFSIGLHAVDILWVLACVGSIVHHDFSCQGHSRIVVSVNGPAEMYGIFELLP